MEERSEDFREALSNIARQARSLLQNFNDGNVQPIEQRMLNQRPRDSGAGVLSTQTPSSSQTVNNTSFRNVESTAVAAQLRNLFPTVGKRSFGSKSSNSKSVKGKKPPPKKAKKDVVHKDVVFLPSPDSRSVPTHQTRCQLENNRFVVHAFPVDKSLQEEGKPVVSHTSRFAYIEVVSPTRSWSIRIHRKSTKYIEKVLIKCRSRVVMLIRSPEVSSQLAVLINFPCHNWSATLMIHQT